MEFMMLNANSPKLLWSADTGHCVNGKDMPEFSMKIYPSRDFRAYF
jgi:hypothetical protein